MKSLILLISIAILVPLNATPSVRIVGGQEAQPHSIPYQVFLEVYRQTQGWYCSGSLISANYVLTAAHCAWGADHALVTLGVHNRRKLEDTQVKINSTEVIVHEKWDVGYLINDIALIKLPQSVSFTEAIQPVKISTDVDGSSVGTTARMSGWGYIRGDTTQMSDVLNYVEADIIPVANCSRELLGLHYVTLNNVCTSGQGDVGSCDGDTGGPLTVDDELIGIVSFGMDYCLPGFPTVFTKVFNYLDWIEGNSDVTFGGEFRGRRE